ncbi:MAG TPA: hypothetical protein VG870_11605 [Chitinophagaceae bacterium]|nr:hypothetical protein [Chitinophagaceae bacterium]
MHRILTRGIGWIGLCLVNGMSIHAQQPGALAGEYYLEGVPEVASGFRLDPDSSFQFFFSYGVVDRYGSGRWEVRGDRIIFNTLTTHTRDFRLADSSRRPGDQLVVRITDPNKDLLGFMVCTVHTADTLLTVRTDAEGYARFRVSHPLRIDLRFLFCPERSTSFPVAGALANYYGFRPEPWLAEYYFSGYELHLTPGGLAGIHPLLAPHPVWFRRQ